LILAESSLEVNLSVNSIYTVNYKLSMGIVLFEINRYVGFNIQIVWVKWGCRGDNSVSW